jgi:DNA-binding transcriptional regulator YdaS (Cro superfamily)
MGIKMTPKETLLLAVDLCQTKAELARRINRKPQEINNWLNRGDKVPVEACPFIANACADPRVTCEALRPDYEGWAVLRTLTSPQPQQPN